MCFRRVMSQSTSQLTGPISHPPSRRAASPDKYAIHAHDRVGRGLRPVSRFVSVGVQRTDLRRDHFPHHTRNLGHYAFKSEGVDPRVETKRVSVCTQRLRRRSGISGSPDATEHCPIRPT